jgi:hypothetical protein
MPITILVHSLCPVCGTHRSGRMTHEQARAYIGLTNIFCGAEIDSAICEGRQRFIWTDEPLPPPPPQQKGSCPVWVV